MNIQVHFRNLRKADDLTSYIEKKIHGIARKYQFRPILTELDVTQIRDKYLMRCKAHGCGFQMLTASDFNVFTCVDLLVEKLNAALRKEKEKRIKQQKKLKSHQQHHSSFYDDELLEPWPIDLLHHDDISYYIDMPTNDRIHQRAEIF